MELYFITGNKGKVASAQRHLNKYEIKLHHREFDISELTVNDIELISKDKVLQAYKKIDDKPCIALDAGFYIANYPNKPNFPGAFPKRDLLNKIGINGLLENMKDVRNRECYFMECLSYYDGTTLKQFTRKIFGTLSESIKGTNKENKWSDLWSVFIPENCEKTIAEMSEEEYSIWSDSKVSVFDDLAIWLKNRKF